MLWLLYCYTVIIFPFADISIGFVQPAYTVQENIGFLDSLVFIQKEGGVVSEQVITVPVECDDGFGMELPPPLFLSAAAVDGT